MKDFSFAITPNKKSIVVRMYAEFYVGTEICATMFHTVIVPPIEDVENLIFQVSEGEL